MDRYNINPPSSTMYSTNNNGQKSPTVKINRNGSIVIKMNNNNNNNDDAENEDHYENDPIIDTKQISYGSHELPPRPFHLNRNTVSKVHDRMQKYIASMEQKKLAKPMTLQHALKAIEQRKDTIRDPVLKVAVEKVKDGLNYSSVAQEDLVSSNNTLKSSQQQLVTSNLELEISLRKCINDRKKALDDMEKIVYNNNVMKEQLRQSYNDLNASRAQIKEWEDKFFNASTMEQKLNLEQEIMIETRMKAYAENVLHAYKVSQDKLKQQFTPTKIQRETIEQRFYNRLPNSSTLSH